MVVPTQGTNPTHVRHFISVVKMGFECLTMYILKCILTDGRGNIHLLDSCSYCKKWLSRPKWTNPWKSNQRVHGPLCCIVLCIVFTLSRLFSMALLARDLDISWSVTPKAFKQSRLIVFVSQGLSRLWRRGRETWSRWRTRGSWTLTRASGTCDSTTRTTTRSPCRWVRVCAHWRMVQDSTSN